jgi:hypothetical protein
MSASPEAPTCPTPHTVTVTDADWDWAADEALSRRWQPDRADLRPRRSQRGTKEEVLVGERVIKRWAAEHDLRLDRRVLRRVTDYGDLLIPPGYRPQDRHVSLIRAVKRVGAETIWTLTGWAWGWEAAERGTLDENLPRPAYVIPPSRQRSMDDLITDLRNPAGDSERVAELRIKDARATLGLDRGKQPQLDLDIEENR